MTTDVGEQRLTTKNGSSVVHNPQEKQINEEEVEDSNASRNSRKSWYSSFTASTVRRSNVSDDAKVNKKTTTGESDQKRRTLSSKLRIKRLSLKDGTAKSNSSNKLSNNMKVEEEQQQLMSTLSAGPSFYCDLATVAEDDLSQICRTIIDSSTTTIDDCRSPQEEEESKESYEYAADDVEVTSPSYQRFLQHVGGGGGGDRDVDSITS